jgi:topoisomerase-4 subunit A
VLFISDAKGSKLVDLSADKHPQILLTFGGKYEHREAETIDAEEFIAKKGLAAKGKKCSPYDLKKVEFGEPLIKPEDEEEEVAEAISDEPIDIDLEAEDLEADAPVTEIEQTGQSSELLKGGEDDTPVDMGDWEPTLF